jgi:hypothetical protein
VFIDGFSRDDFAAFVRAVPWRLAKTMDPSPHEYTPRKQTRELGLESEFESAVRLIREEGYRQPYGSKVYVLRRRGRRGDCVAVVDDGRTVREDYPDKPRKDFVGQRRLSRSCMTMQPHNMQRAPD